MNNQDDDKHLETQGWNAYEKKSNTGLYIIIAAVCFVLAWIISGAA